MLKILIELFFQVFLLLFATTIRMFCNALFSKYFMVYFTFGFIQRNKLALFDLFELLEFTASFTVTLTWHAVGLQSLFGEKSFFFEKEK